MVMLYPRCHVEYDRLSRRLRLTDHGSQTTYQDTLSAEDIKSVMNLFLRAGTGEHLRFEEPSDSQSAGKVYTLETLPDRELADGDPPWERWGEALKHEVVAAAHRWRFILLAEDRLGHMEPLGVMWISVHHLTDHSYEVTGDEELDLGFKRLGEVTMPSRIVEEAFR